MRRMAKVLFEGRKELDYRVNEAYKSLRTNVQFSGTDVQVIDFTSCTPNEGKSSVSFNLAVSFADSGKRVVMIDADMRKSILANRHQIQGIEKGLSHYLSGQADMTEVVYSTNKKNFFMLPCGLFPVNPTELLGNGRLDKLLEGLKKTFDYIIIDTPPLGSVIDAAVVAKRCDGSVLVLEADRTPKSMAKSVKEQLQAANPNIVGVVLNKVDTHKGSYYGKKYGSYYGKYYK